MLCLRISVENINCNNKTKTKEKQIFSVINGIVINGAIINLKHIILSMQLNTSKQVLDT